MGATSYQEKLLQLRPKLVKSEQNNLNFCHFKIVFQSPYKLRTFFHFKHTLDKKFVKNMQSV